MLAFILRRILWMIPTLLVISIISFTIIQLPPGDYLTSYVTALEETGETVTVEQAAALRKLYDLDQPFVIQYLKWLNGLSPVGLERKADGALGGLAVKWPDMGRSFEENLPVSKVIGERLLLTVVLSVATLLFTWAVAIPIGIYSAVKQYSWGDYVFTALGFLGIATPAFLLALVLMYIGDRFLGASIGGLFSPEFQTAPWSWARAADLAAHLWIPVFVIGIGGTAGMIRIMRGNLLDELRKQYVVAARAKGLGRVRLLLKYPVRVAINPMISTVGWVLPGIVSGGAIASIVMGLPTIGPRLLQALMNQDMYLAGSMVMLLAALTVIGTLISDILLAWLDPRIRYEMKE